MALNVKLIDLANKFGFSPDYFADQAKAGRFIAKKVGRLWYSTEAHIANFIRTLPGPGRPSKAGKKSPAPKGRFERPAIASQKRAALRKKQIEAQEDAYAIWASDKAIRDLKNKADRDAEVQTSLEVRSEAIRLTMLEMQKGCPKCGAPVTIVKNEWNCPKCFESDDLEKLVLRKQKLILRKTNITNQKALIQICSCGTTFNSCGGVFDQCHKCRS